MHIDAHTIHTCKTMQIQSIQIFCTLQTCTYKAYKSSASYKHAHTKHTNLFHLTNKVHTKHTNLLHLTNMHIQSIQIFCTLQTCTYKAYKSSASYKHLNRRQTLWECSEIVGNYTKYRTMGGTNLKCTPAKQHGIASSSASVSSWPRWKWEILIKDYLNICLYLF